MILIQLVLLFPALAIAPPLQALLPCHGVEPLHWAAVSISKLTIHLSSRHPAGAEQEVIALDPESSCTAPPSLTTIMLLLDTGRTGEAPLALVFDLDGPNDGGGWKCQRASLTHYNESLIGEIAATKLGM